MIVPHTYDPAGREILRQYWTPQSGLVLMHTATYDAAVQLSTWVRRRMHRLMLNLRNRKILVDVIPIVILLVVSLTALLFCGRKDPNKLALKIGAVMAEARAQDYRAFWCPAHSDIIVINVTSAHPNGFGRQELHDLGTKYYLAFYHCRRAAGYSVIDSLHCTVDIDIDHRVIARRWGYFALCD